MHHNCSCLLSTDSPDTRLVALLTESLHMITVDWLIGAFSDSGHVHVAAVALLLRRYWVSKGERKGANPLSVSGAASACSRAVGACIMLPV